PAPPPVPTPIPAPTPAPVPPPPPTPGPRAGDGQDLWSDWERGSQRINHPATASGSTTIVDIVEPTPADTDGATHWEPSGFLSPQPDGTNYLRVLPLAQLPPATRN